MSIEIIVYTKQLSDDLIPKIVSRLNDFDMDCEVYPGFSFNEHIGFLPFKFKFRSPPFEILTNKELVSGFELCVDNFNFEQEKLRSQPKLGLIQRLTGRKHPSHSLFSVDIDKRIKHCVKKVSFTWQVADSFEVRFASIVSAILSELTDGVCSYPADGVWYENQNFAEKTWGEVRAYETNILTERTLKFHEFTNWEDFR